MPIKRLALTLAAAVIATVTLLTSPLILAGSATDQTLLPIDRTAQNPLPPPQSLTFMDYSPQNTAQISPSTPLTATIPPQPHTSDHLTAPTSTITPTAENTDTSRLTFVFPPPGPPGPPGYPPPRLITFHPGAIS